MYQACLPTSTSCAQPVWSWRVISKGAPPLWAGSWLSRETLVHCHQDRSSWDESALSSLPALSTPEQYSAAAAPCTEMCTSLLPSQGSLRACTPQAGTRHCMSCPCRRAEKPFRSLTHLLSAGQTEIKSRPQSRAVEPKSAQPFLLKGFHRSCSHHRCHCRVCSAILCPSHEAASDPPDLAQGPVDLQSPECLTAQRTASPRLLGLASLCPQSICWAPKWDMALLEPQQQEGRKP